MHTTMNSNLDLLSVCIPTYNRCSYLDKLLDNLNNLNLQYPLVFSIYVSDNNSSDNTKEIVEKWQQVLKINYTKQSVNVGAALNLLDVLKMPNSEWSLLIGDDDILDLNEFGRMLDILSVGSRDIWYIMGVQNKNGERLYIKEKHIGIYSGRKLIEYLKKTSLDNIGFMGAHLIPNRARDFIKKIPNEYIRPWPHISLLLLYANSREFKIINCYPVIQLPEIGGLSWKYGDWVHIRMAQLAIFKKPELVFQNRRVASALYRRYTLSSSLIKDMILWRALDGGDFDQRSYVLYSKQFRLLGIYAFFNLHMTLVWILLRIITHKFLLEILIKLKVKTVINYQKLAISDPSSDGVARGL